MSNDKTDIKLNVDLICAKSISKFMATEVRFLNDDIILVAGVDEKIKVVNFVTNQTTDL
jgi:hypothetical protein